MLSNYSRMETRLFTREEDVGFWKNLFLVAVFFTIAPITIGISIFSLFSLNKTSETNIAVAASNLIASPQSGLKVYASLPTKTASVSDEVGMADARGEIVKQYLQSYNSPLTPYSDYIVQEADLYSLDFRLTTAIAQQESNLCKAIPPDSFNCWGWGIHSKGTLGFSSFEQGIDEVSKGLRQEYLDKGYNSVEDIMSKYTPLSNGSWAVGVNTFMSDMQ